MSTATWWTVAGDLWEDRCDDTAHNVRNQSRSCTQEDRHISVSSMSRIALNRTSSILMALAIITIVTCPVTMAFSTTLHRNKGILIRPLQLKHTHVEYNSQRRYPTFVSLYRDHENDESDDEDENGEDEEDVVFYDDFGGTVVGGVEPPVIVYQDMDVTIGSDDDSSDDAHLNQGLQVLSERIAQTRDSQVQRDTRLAKNWRMGNWKVRGFQLDGSSSIHNHMDTTTQPNTNTNHPRTTKDADSTAALVTGGPRLDNINQNSDDPQTNDPLSKLMQEMSSNNKDTAMDASHTSNNYGPIHVSKIATDISSSSGGLESNVLAVGRTDGSICIVELGTQYLTKFTAVPKLVVEPGNNSETEDGGMSVRIQSELMNQDEVKEAMRDDHGKSDESDERYTMPRPKQDGENEMNFSDGMDESFGEGDGDTPDDDVAMEQDTMGTPFKILHQFQAHDEGDCITALVLDEGHVYSAGGNKGDIKVWAIPEKDDQENEYNNGSEVRSTPKMIPVKSLSNAHDDTVVALKTLSMDGSEDHQLLLSAAVDGSFALWDRMSGDLVFRCQITDDYGEPVGVTCADVETSGEDHVIYLGLSTGHVVGYIVNDVIASASIGDECLVPSCRFVAQEADSGGLTALTCAGDGTIGISSRNRSGQKPQSSTVLLTGGADGTIKQWEMMPRKIPPGPDGNKNGPSIKLEHWPRLTTQRMQRRAHLFRGHSGPITALVCNDPSKFLSAGADGTVRIWSPSKGIEMFRMDGFSDSCRSLCLDHDLLVTDGMEEYVCVHDFDVTDAEIEEGYKLEW
eukprot:CAMPEP_0198284766 /NCGR_PEP_ID=MMETSP1449-20131203/4204_1 /TAXON_ID=420275 /ORGANISM="Attheya septentrionalis, Strain CCMP2084" /LENGTH=794 /DNA_ID=CAMNT_0043981979 /DNA_START=260 /DNA_END=2644 /DNA_ORIENTATION=+